MEIQLFIQDFQIQVVDSKRDTTWSNDYLHLKKLMDDGVLDNNQYLGIHIAGEIICQEKEKILDMIKQMVIIFFMKYMIGQKHLENII